MKGVKYRAGQDAEETLAYYLRLLAPDLPLSVRQYSPKGLSRAWVCDFCWLEQKVVVEVQGQVHAIKEKRVRDCEKINGLQVEGGYVVLQFTPAMIRDNPDAVIAIIRQALSLRV